MNRQWMWLIGLSATLAFTACSDKDPITEPDTDQDGEDDVDDTGNDTDVPEGSLELAEVCRNNDQCESGLCVTLGQGINDSLCSQRCETPSNCGDPGMWDCTDVDSALNDNISVCVPKGLCLDADGDDYGVGPGCLGPDCDDSDPTIYFGAAELCDGKDNDCNGIIDDHTAIEGTECNTGLFGLCSVGRYECIDGAASCQIVTQPGQLREQCSGLDEDCDGLVDEGRAEDQNDNYIALVGQSCSDQGDGCENGINTCVPGRGVVCETSSTVVDDSCDGRDNDCNGTVDDAVVGLNRPCVVGKGACLNQGITICDADPYDPPICDVEANNDNAGPELCDYIDNDCNGTVDDPFVNSSGVYNKTEHCGACGNDCNASWANNAYAATVQPVCNVQGSLASCGYTCKPGFLDLDIDGTNGCEHEVNKHALYVAPRGRNIAFCGSPQDPCADITYGLYMASVYNSDPDPENHRNVIVVAEGIYREGVTLPNGISLKGGHNATNWTRSIQEYRTIIVGSVLPTGDRYTVLAEGITKPTELSGFTIIGEDGQNGANSIGVLVRNSTSALTIRDNVIRAGLGGQGQSGQAGQDGSSGGDGLAGLNGENVNLLTCSAANELAGGNPGAAQCNTPGSGATVNVSGGRGAKAVCPTYGGPGAAPQAGLGPNPGAAGFTAFGRGKYEQACYPHPNFMDQSFPRDGVIGGLGNDGQGGQGATNANGALAPNGMWRGQVGESAEHGAHGSGGGGGGASHGTLACTSINGDIFENCDRTRLIGASGGGGGAGGCAGAAATGGGGGGASIALYIHYSSTPASTPVITDNLLERNFGGQGGDGGIGGRGGDGGRGGSGGTVPALQDFCPQAGRRGGNGGRGGHGGGGGGGAGGISFDIAVFGVTVSGTALIDDNDFSVPAGDATGGIGGPGGGSMGRPGLKGVDGQSGNLFNP